jgi:hypothetical protein
MKISDTFVKLVVLVSIASMNACVASSSTIALDKLDEGASIEGVWQDIKWGDLVTVRAENGGYRVAAVIDSQSAEEFSIRSSAWDGKTLSYTYTIPSNKTTVIASIGMLKGEYLAGKWRLDDNTNSGEFKCKRLMTGVAAAARRDDAGKKEIDRLLGKIYQVKGDLVVIASASMSQVRPHDIVYVYIGGQKARLKVLFPMMTIAKCALEPEDTRFRDMLAAGMPVYR